MKITITQENINNGGLGEEDCPVALAVIEAGLGRAGYTFVKVDGEIFVNCYPDRSTKYLMDLETQAIIEAYDLTGEMTPFETEIS